MVAGNPHEVCHLLVCQALTLLQSSYSGLLIHHCSLYIEDNNYSSGLQHVLGPGFPDEDEKDVILGTQALPHLPTPWGES